MDHLHSYWRIDYVKAPKKEGEFANPFIEIPKSKEDRKVHLLLRGEYTFIVLNKFPYSPGHLLVVPYREVPTLDKLSIEESSELMENLILGQKLLEETVQPHGFNIGFNIGSAAGAGIPKHLHAHIVPRWDGDTNFMPVLGSTRVLPESMDRMWEKLRETLLRLQSEKT